MNRLSYGAINVAIRRSIELKKINSKRRYKLLTSNQLIMDRFILSKLLLEINTISVINPLVLSSRIWRSSSTSNKRTKKKISRIDWMSLLKLERAMPIHSNEIEKSISHVKVNKLNRPRVPKLQMEVAVKCTMTLLSLPSLLYLRRRITWCPIRLAQQEMLRQLDR